MWLYSATKGPWFSLINTPLRLAQQAEPHVVIVTTTLEAATKKLPVYTGRVYRGIRVEDLAAFMRDYDVGATVVWPAFSSSSLDRAYAVEGNVLFMIESKNGRQIGKYADLWEEQEVVFTPKSRFRVLAFDMEQTTSKATIYLEQLTP